MSGFSVAERWQLEVKDVEPVVEIPTECAAFDGGPQVAVRGRDDPHVDGDLDVSADAHEPPRLQDPEQARLERLRHLRDLIEE